ncbi:hypothetical protein [Dyella agri]|uniref:DUF4261 domain-containing protein n=1 Tax=Dyella agri TaxID=1926869 RepID=A0ABW8KGF1_9GAMM
MTEAQQTPEWLRPYWQPGADEDALLQFYVFGKFERELVIPAMRYGSPGLPEGVSLQRFQNLELRKWEGYPLAGTLGEILRDEVPETFEQARIAPDVLVIRGQLPDGASLDYLRDTLGVLAALLDIGGRAILDPQILSLFDVEAWRERYLVKDGAPPRNHVLILRSDEADGGRSHVHTRGMRKFGRPDLSFRQVPPQELDRVGALCEKLVEMQALGVRFVAGQALEVEGMEQVLIAQPGGRFDDPEFNNRHVAFRWPF